MSQYSIRYLIGNVTPDEADAMDDARQQPRPSSALPDSPTLEQEMAAAFGWNAEPTDEETERHYAAMKCDEQDLVNRYPGLKAKGDQELIDIIAQTSPGVALMEDADEVTAVAAILLTRRLNDPQSMIPVLAASLIHERAKRQA